MCQEQNSGAPDFSFSQQQCHVLSSQKLPKEFKAATKIFRHCKPHPQQLQYSWCSCMFLFHSFHIYLFRVKEGGGFSYMCGLFKTSKHRRVGTLIVATIYLQLIQNRYMFRSFTLLQCSHQHCLQPVASDVEVVG